MSGLIEELKKEHNEIVDAINEVKGLGIVSSEAQAKLTGAKTGLIAHLKKEDERLYPVLRKKAKNDKRLKGILDMFAKDIENISKDLIEFFDKYSKGGSSIEFAKDFGRIFVTLGQRIWKEENILFPEYEKI